MSKIYDSDYSVRLATLGAMGGDTTKCYDSVYEIDLEILKIIEGGGIGGAKIDDNTISTETVWSSSKIVSELANAGFDVQVVQELPATGEAHTLYFVPSTDPKTQNIYDEYLYANNAWEQVGSTAVDMSDYYTKTQVDTLLDDYATKNDISTFITEDDLANLNGYATQNELTEDEDVISNTVAFLNKKVDDNTEQIDNKANKADITVLKTYADNIYAKSSKDLNNSDNITAAGIYYSVKSYDDSIKNIISISQTAYDALQDKDAKTVYIIIPE